MQSTRPSPQTLPELDTLPGCLWNVTSLTYLPFVFRLVSAYELRWTDCVDTILQGSVVLDAGCGNGKYLGCSSVLGSKLSLTSTNGDVDNNSGLTKSSKKGKGRANEPEAGGETRVFENVPHILPIGFDMSHGLLAIAAGNGHEAVRGDCFDLSCWRRGVIVSLIRIESSVLS